MTGSSAIDDPRLRRRPWRPGRSSPSSARRELVVVPPDGLGRRVDARTPPAAGTTSSPSRSTTPQRTSRPSGTYVSTSTRVGVRERRVQRRRRSSAASRTSVTPSELSASTGLTTTGGATVGASSPRRSTSPGGHVDARRGDDRAWPWPCRAPSAMTSGGLPTYGMPSSVEQRAVGRHAGQAEHLRDARRRAPARRCARRRPARRSGGAAAIASGVEVGREPPAPVGRHVRDDGTRSAAGSAVAARQSAA